MDRIELSVSWISVKCINQLCYINVRGRTGLNCRARVNSPPLYQLSYAPFVELVRLKLTVSWVQIRCFSQLSYSPIAEYVGFEPLLLIDSETCYHYTTYSILRKRRGSNPQGCYSRRFSRPVQSPAICLHFHFFTVRQWTKKPDSLWESGFESISTCRLNCYRV